MDNDDFHDWSPYDHMVQMNMLLEDIIRNHNNLVQDYEQTLLRLKTLEEQVLQIQAQQFRGRR